MKQTKNFTSIKKEVETYIVNSYTRKPVAFVKSKGCYMTTTDGKPVLDFFPGWGVSNLGYCHPHVSAAISRQSKNFIHMANVFYNPLQAETAKLIVKNTFPGKVFFCNSGTEAVESALKTARAWGNDKGKTDIISFIHSFHGRTTGSLALTGQSKYRNAFVPLLPGVNYARFNDLDSVRELITDKTAAVILELVQGEGGVHVADKNFILGLKKLSQEKDFLLIFDEIQTGFGRTGKLFAFQNYGIIPDMLCLAKAIAGGVPMGAAVMGKKAENILTPGMHASTFGGNPLACAACIAVFKAFEKEKILEKMKPVQKKLVEFFISLTKKYPIVRFSYLGMMFGLEMQENLASRIADLAFENGLIINCTAERVVRIMPALNMSMKDCLKGIKILEKVFEEVCTK
ncbi:MAG: acetylornithine/succinylornithine family transaminase [Candidatus Aureabacteria bacterium]|nr:acetylornithine/succinylornithine family transaminase [Candidatus Auribacterota bacterium]